MAINERATVEVQVNGEQARQELQDLRQYATNLSAALTKAYEAGDKKQIKALTKELKSTNSQMRTLQRTVVDIDKVMSNLSLAGPKELKQTIRSINTELNSGRVKRGSKEWDEYTSKLRAVNAELKKIDEESGRINKNLFEKAADAASRMWGLYTIGTDVYDKISNYANQRVDAYAKMEEAQSQVVKYTDMEKKSVKELNESFKKLDTRTKREKLNELAGDAGKLGENLKERVLDFVDAGNQINIALGEDLGDDAVKEIAKLTKMFGEDDKLGLRGGMLATASAINTLGQSSTAAEPYLAQFLGQVGSVGKQAKMTQADLLGYASVLDQNKVEAAVAATAFQQLTMKMFQDPTKYAQIAGKDVKAFTELLKTDSNQALLQFLTGLSKLGDLTEAAPVIKTLGLEGQKSAQVLTALAGNITLIEKEQDTANKAYKEATSVTKEYNVQNNTTLANMEKAQNRANNIAVELGERLYPIMRAGLHLGAKTSNILIVIIDFISKHKNGLMAVAASLLVYNTLLKLHNGYLIVTNTLTKIGTTLRVLYAVATANLTGNLSGANKIMLLFNASIIKNNAIQKVCAVGVYLYSAAHAVLTGNIKAATVAVRALWTTLIRNPVVAVAAAITAIGIAVYKFATNTSEADKAAKDFTSRNISLQRELKKTYDALMNTADGTRQRKEVIKEFNQKYGEYLGNLLSEEASLQDIKKAYNEVGIAMQHKLAVQVLSDKTDEIEREGLDKKADLLDKVQTTLSKGLTDGQLSKAMPLIVRYTDELIKQGMTVGDVSQSIAISLGNTYGSLKKYKLVQPISDDLKKYVKQVKSTADEVQKVKTKLNPFLPQEKKLPANELPEVIITGTVKGKAVPETEKEENKRVKKEMTQLETDYLKEVAELKKKYMSSDLMTQQEFANEAEKLELKKLNRQMLIVGIEPEKREEINQKILDAKLKLVERVKAFDKTVSVDQEAKLQSELERIDRDYEKKHEMLEYSLAQDLISTTRYEEIKKKLESDAEAERTVAKGKEAKKRLELEEKRLEKELTGIEKERYTKYLTDEQLNQAIRDSRMSWITRMLEDTTLSESIRLELQREYAQLELDEMDEKYDKMREKNELYVNMVTDIASSLGSAMADVLSNEEDAMKNLLKQMLLSAVSAIEAYVRLAYVKVITEGILTGGISLGKGLLQIAAIETSFAVVKGLIGNFYTGGFTSSGAWDKPQGIVHSNEFVANRFAVGNSEILPVLKLIDTAQKNNTVGSLTSQDVSGVLRVGGQNQSAAVEVIQTTDPETKRLIAECTTVMQTITKRFEKRIIAETYITGKGGINEALSDYDKLMKNVKR